MNVFTVSLFGHREIESFGELEKRLLPIVRKLIQKNPYVSFFIGRNGEFDEYAASIIKAAQRACGKENNDITLILPYKVAKIEYYEKYYDDIIIPCELYGAHHKLAITFKNRWMIDRSDLVVVYVKNEKGGAYTAMKYAEKLNKRVINLADEAVFENN